MALKGMVSEELGGGGGVARGPVASFFGTVHGVELSFGLWKVLGCDEPLEMVSRRWALLMPRQGGVRWGWWRRLGWVGFVLGMKSGGNYIVVGRVFFLKIVAGG